MRDYSILLKDIITSIEAAERFTAGMSFDNFTSDDKTNFAVVRCMEIIGEASKSLPAEIRDAHSEIPWKAIVGTRNIIAHAYAEVDLAEVWNTVKNDLPRLKPQVQKILEELR
jgi:uncharacterized protein with HEPN domain